MGSRCDMHRRQCELHFRRPRTLPRRSPAL